MGTGGEGESTGDSANTYVRGRKGDPQEQTFSDKTGGDACRASQLAPFARVHFHVMKGCTHRNS